MEASGGDTQRYGADRAAWAEGTRFRYNGRGAELGLFFPAPTPEEIRAVRSAPVRLGVLGLEGIILVVYAVAGVPVGDALYSWHQVPQAVRARPAAPRAGERLLPPVVLVDAAGGVVRAIRAVTTSPRVWRLLAELFHEQVTRPFDRRAYDQALARVSARLTSEALARRAIMDPAGEE